MTCGKGDVYITGLADGFAVVEAFHYGQKATVLLDQASKRVEDTGAGRATLLFPLGLGAASGFNGFFNLGIGTFGEACETLIRCGINDGDVITQWSPCAVDKRTGNAAAVRKPSQGFGAAFRGGAVVHSVEDVFDGHGWSFFNGGVSISFEEIGSKSCEDFGV